MPRTLSPAARIERSILSDFRKPLWRPFVRGIKQYKMIAPGDHIAVCISGGKDSMLLAKMMQLLQRHTDIPFETEFLVMDPGYNAENRQRIIDNAALMEIPIRIFDSSIFETTKIAESNPCYLCARLRSGFLYDRAQELGCNKVALGHHLDDAVETFYMNLWREGRIGCFSPVTYLDQRNITLIRPMIFATESEVKSAVYHAGLPIIKSRCPADGATVREQTKLFVQQMSRDDPAFRQKTLHALQQSGIDGWRPLHTGHTRG